ncbi:hypothetical protein ACTA71_005862 [Dictyostelium dimigraforme]
MKIIFLFLLIFFVYEIIGFAIPQPKVINSSKESLVYIYDVDSSYFSKLLFSDSNYDLPFNCINDGNNKTCTAIIDDQIAKKLHGSVSSCMVSSGAELCGIPLNPRDYPNPIIVDNFKPSTKGGQVKMKGYYLAIGILNLNIFPNIQVPIIGNPTGVGSGGGGGGKQQTIDATNLILDYNGGCGQRTLIWPNRFYYYFNHSNPIIDSISIDHSSLAVVGSNFCNSSNNIIISIDGIQMDKSGIISIDHQLFKVNYHQLYCKSIYVSIISGGLQSNIFKFDFKPLPLKINSVPKSRGGLITITGERLSSQVKNSIITVNIGEYVCKNVLSIQNVITCKIDPIPASNFNFTGLQVNISINGIINDNKLLFSFENK